MEGHCAQPDMALALAALILQDADADITVNPSLEVIWFPTRHPPLRTSRRRKA